LQGQLNFDLYECQLTTKHEKKDYRLLITLAGNGRVFEFKFLDENVFKEWFECINEQIEQSLGKINSLRAPKANEFWRF